MAFFLGCVGAGILACGPQATSGPAPSFVLITLDTTRADRLGPYGHAEARTPHLDRFATTARTYTRALSPSSWTLPAHASIFTGLLPFEHGAGGYGGEGAARMRSLEPHFETLAERLEATGYQTAGIVAGSALAPDLGTDQGFGVYESKVSYFGQRGKWVADRALELLESFGEEPFFLFLNFFDPHTPYKPPGFWGAGIENQTQLSRLLLRAGLPTGEAAPVDAEEERMLGAALKGYDAEIRYMDHQLGRVLKAIESLPQAGRTWIVITSDHGESFGEHLYLLHGLHLYEDNLRVPLLVHEPGDPRAGERIDVPVQTHRIFGAILRAAGVALPEGADTHALEEGPIVASLPRTYLAEQVLGERAKRELRALYRHPYKLITEDGGAVELYDLDTDPGELRDLSAKLPELAAELHAELAAILAAKPARFHDDGDEVEEETADALRAMGYIE